MNMFGELSFWTVGLTVSVCYLLYILFKARGYSPPLPPSPGRCLPIIGHAYLLKEDMRGPLRRFRQKCGDVYSLQLGSIPAVVISGYECVKDAFKTQGDAFSHRPKLFVLDKLTRGGQGIVMSTGETWREHRRFALSTLKDFGMGKSKLEIKILEEAYTLVEEIQKLNGQPFDPKELITAHVANIICSMVFRQQFKHDDPRFLEMIRILDENLKSIAGVANFFPWAAWIPGDPLKVRKIVANSDAIFSFCENIVAEHVENYNENNIDDLTSAYIKELKRHDLLGEQTTMNYAYLSATIFDLFLAGSETTTTTLRWSFVCLVEFPEVQDRMFREIESHIGTDRQPSVEDRKALTYVEAFFMEVLRYCNITIILGLHAVSENVMVHGYTIPTEVVVIPDIDSIFSDPNIWGDPDNFRPERFLDEKGNIVKREEFVAFFLGKRSCIGESLAKMELFLFLSCLVQRFRFESPQEEPVSMATADGEFGVTHCPKPYRIVCVPRQTK